MSCCFCRPPSDGPNSSLSAAAYVPVTGGHSGKLGTMLWQWCLDRPPGIYYVLSAVSPQLSHAADFLLAYLRRSDALISLRWLRVPECIRSKVAVMVYKVLHSRAPSYLGPFTCISNLPSRQGLHCSSSDCLVQPPVHRSTAGSRVQYIQLLALKVWNCLPPEVTSAPSLATFRTRFKTFLFTESYSDIWLT